MLVLFFQQLLSSTNRLHSPLPPVTLVPISFYRKGFELCVTLQWLCFGQTEALEAGSTSLFSTVDWTTSALWSLVRDSRRSCGLHTIMSAIFHSWVSWYCSMTAAASLLPLQAWLIARPAFGGPVCKLLKEVQYCVYLYIDIDAIIFPALYDHNNCLNHNNLQR